MGSARSRLSLLYIALFFELGVSLPFFPLWLQSQALGKDAIGIVLAAPLLIRIVANPVAGALADRSGRISLILAICAVLVAAGTGLLGLVAGFWPILAVVIAIALVQGPLIALTDAMTLGRLARLPLPELSYGRIRLWGSIGFAAASLLAGWTLDWFPASAILAFLLISAVLTAAAAIGCIAPDPVGAGDAGAHEAPILQPVLLACTIAGAALVQASHAAYYGFSTLHWQANGMPGLTMGGLWALGILSEIALFAILGHRMRGSRWAAGMLVAAAAVATLRWSLMSLDPGLPGLVLLQLGHGVTFGVTHLASIFLLSRLAPGTMQASAQAWLAGGWAGIMAVLTAFCGHFYESWGEQIYLVMAAVGGVGCALLLPVAIGLRRAVGREQAALT